MANVTKLTPITTGYIQNVRGYKKLEIENHEYLLVFRRDKRTNYCPLYQVELYQKQLMTSNSTLSKQWVFDDELSAMQKFMHLSFNKMAS